MMENVENKTFMKLKLITNLLFNWKKNNAQTERNIIKEIEMMEKNGEDETFMKLKLIKVTTQFAENQPWQAIWLELEYKTFS